ncbi:DsbA family protein [Spirosoma arcticum]
MNLLPNDIPVNPGSTVDAVDLVEYVDFTCPRCRQSREVVNTVLNTFKGQITYTFHYFPKYRSELSLLAALATEAARRQGQFWPMYHALFKQSPVNQAALSTLATCLGLNHNRFVNDLADEQIRHCIEADQQEGYRLGVTKTPALFVAGQQFHGKLTQSRLFPIIRSHLAQYARHVLSTVDLHSGTIYWGKGEWV